MWRRIWIVLTPSEVLEYKVISKDRVVLEAQAGRRDIQRMPSSNTKVLKGELAHRVTG